MIIVKLKEYNFLNSVLNSFPVITCYEKVYIYNFCLFSLSFFTKYFFVSARKVPIVRFHKHILDMLHLLWKQM